METRYVSAVSIREVNLWGARNANQKLFQAIISTELQVLEWSLPAVQPLQLTGAEWRSLMWLTQSTDSPAGCPTATVGLWCLLFVNAGVVTTISQRTDAFTSNYLEAMADAVPQLPVM